MRSTIYNSGNIYDKTYSYSQDIECWHNLTKGKEAILELCCGTGRIIQSLLSDHRTITGIDNSKQMLDEAKAKTKAFQDKVYLYKRNITRFNLKQTFDSILLVNNSFGHLHREQDVFSFQECLKKHMTSGTEFILEVSPKSILQHYNFTDTPVSYSAFIDTTDGKTIDVSEKSEYTSGTNLIKQEWLYYKENQLIRKSSLHVRFYNPQEIQNLFEKNGFRITMEYGNYDHEPFSPSSYIYILIIKRK